MSIHLQFILGKFLRHPRTTQELRSAEAAIEQDVPVRRKRLGFNLPNVRDDLWIHHAKSWKHTTRRRRRWR